MLKNLKFFIISSLLFISAPYAFGHELWLDTPNFQPEIGSDVAIDIRNGQNFSGINLSYFSSRVRELFYDMNGKRDPASREGDVPAMTIPNVQDGLLRAVYVSRPEFITYSDWNKFVEFTQHKDLEWALTEHTALGFDTTNFRERYFRFSKALIGVGSAQGNDIAYGLEYELVALTNPYGLSGGQNVLVELRYQDIARPNTQIEVFEMSPDQTVEVFRLRTDAQGRVAVPVRSGYKYLVDSVLIRPAPDRGQTPKSPVWETLWAALTFEAEQ